jgi:long-chain acyl-CoA synthetase
VNSPRVDCYQTVASRLTEWGSHPVLVECADAAAVRVLGAGDTLAEIERISGLLDSAGIGPGDITALFLRNSVDFVCVFLALLRVGAVPAPLKLEYRAAELEQIFANAQPAAVVAEAAHLPHLEPYLADTTVFAREAAGLRLLRRRGHSAPAAPLPAGTASVNYTYRGIGLPLGALVPHRQYHDGAEILQGGLQGQPGEKMLVVLPLSHIFALVGCLFVPLLYGMTAVICPSLHPRLLFSVLAGQGIEYLTAVPELLLLLANCRGLGPSLPRLRAFVSGGSSLPASAFETVRQAFGVELMHGYGLTEFAPVSRNIRGATRPGTVGPVGEGIECRICHPGSEGAGEIQFRCPGMARGYLRRTLEWDEAVEGGWFGTGDEGRLEGGHLVFLRERKATCKVNGNMVDLAEVRRLVLSFPGVATAEVRPSGRGLEARIRADKRTDAHQLAEELRRYMLDRIASYKVPSRITCS